jgi:hypothetical protein
MLPIIFSETYQSLRLALKNTHKNGAKGIPKPEALWFVRTKNLLSLSVEVS